MGVHLIERAEGQLQHSTAGQTNSTVRLRAWNVFPEAGCLHREVARRQLHSTRHHIQSTSRRPLIGPPENCDTRRIAVVTLPFPSSVTLSSPVPQSRASAVTVEERLKEEG